MGGLTSTLVLVVVLAGLGGYIYFVDSKRPDGAGIDGEPAKDEGLHGRSRQDRRDPLTDNGETSAAAQDATAAGR